MRDYELIVELRAMKLFDDHIVLTEKTFTLSFQNSEATAKVLDDLAMLLDKRLYTIHGRNVGLSLEIVTT